MAIKIRGKSDPVLRQIRDALKSYCAEHQKAQVEIYRQGPVSVRVRILDPDFKGMDKAERHDAIWDRFNDLDEEIQSDVSLLLLLTPEEARTSFANMEFDHPVSSRL